MGRGTHPRLSEPLRWKIHLVFDARKSEAIPAHPIHILIKEKSRAHAMISGDLDMGSCYMLKFIL